MKHRNHPAPPFVHGWTALAIVAVLLGKVLAACGQPAASQAPDQQAARSTALAAIDDAFAGTATADGEDSVTVSVLAAIKGQGQPVTAAELSPAAVEPMLVIRRVDMQRRRLLLTFDYDVASKPATATAEVAIEMTGNAQIWRVWPDRSSPRELPAPVRPGDDTPFARLLDPELAPDGYVVIGLQRTRLGRSDVPALSVTYWDRLMLWSY